MTEHLELYTHSLDFGGFYESCWQDEIDAQIKSALDFALEESGIENNDLQIKACRAVADDLILDFDTSAMQKEICESWIQGFSLYLVENWELPKAEADKITSANWVLFSPREYNFATDSIEIDLPLSVYKALWNLIKNNDDFVEYVKAHTTSYDGYRSYYSADDVLSGDDDLCGDSRTAKAKRIYITSFLSDSMGADDDFDAYYYVLDDLFLDTGELVDKLKQGFTDWLAKQ